MRFMTRSLPAIPSELPLQGEVLPRSLSPDSLVLQHNSLARGNYELDLDIDDVRLLNAAMAMLERDADVLGDVTLTVNDMRRIFPSYSSSGRSYDRVSEACGRIMGLVAHITHGPQSWDKITLIKTARYRSGTITISFHEEAKSLFLRLSGNFTSYRVQAIQNLTTTTQVLLYQVARSYAHVGGWDISAQMLRQALNIRQNAYPEEHRFIARVLKPAVEHINADERADIVLSYTPLRNGRTIVGYKFRVSMKDASPLTISDLVAIELLEQEGISTGIATRSVRQYGGTTCVAMISSTRYRASRTDQTPLESPARYLGKLLSEGIMPAVKDPAYDKIHAGMLLAFRLRIYSRLTPEAQRAHLQAFKQSLPPRLQMELDLHRDPTATGALQAAWHQYVPRFVANTEGGIVVTKVQPSLNRNGSTRSGRGATITPIIIAPAPGTPQSVLPPQPSPDERAPAARRAKPKPPVEPAAA